MDAGASPTTSVWDVSDRADGEQFGYWHEVICQAFVPLVPRSSIAGPGFAARVETRSLHDMVRARIWSQPQETAHGPREVARTDGAFFFVNLQVAGRCLVRQGRAESVVGPGQFTVLDTTEPYYLDFDARWRMISFRLPRDLLADRLGGMAPVLAEPMDGRRGPGGVVRSMMTSLWNVELPADSAASAELEQAFASAVAAASAGRPAFTDQPRAVLRAEVLRHVRGRLGDSSLSVASVCARLGISPRTLHAAFADGERTFAATVRRLRLERCAMLLADPLVPGTITTIAASVGFDDPASFSRAFRREFGRTPSEVRGSTAPNAQSIGTQRQDSGD